jgi:GH35 family endo-1,4-beta-xylanase
MKTIYNNYNILSCLMGLIISLFGLTACKKNTQFSDGNRLYIVHADSAVSFSGYNRLKISFVVPDQSAVTAKIYWNDRKNSVTIPIHKAAGTDSVSTIIGPLDEGNYSFEVITYDASGVTSIPVKIAGTVYGPKYALTLPNRQVKDITYDAGTVSVSLGAAAVGAVRSEITYNDVSNVSHTVNVPVGTSTVTLSNVNPGVVGALSTTFQHRTFIHPTLAIDTLNTPYQTDTVITATLAALAKAKNVQFGSLISVGGGITNGVINDGSPNGIYTNICNTQFNIGTAAWGATRWSQTGNSDFSDVNAVINWSRPKYDKVMLIGIVGPDVYMPSWFTTGTFTPSQMDVMLKNLITEIMTSNDNKSKVDVWCVANELFSNDGTYNTMKWNDMGWEDDASGLTGTDQINLRHPVFISKAFKYCKQITNALLELRDFGIEHGETTSSYNHKHKAYYQLLKHLIAKGTPVNVVGIQAHMAIGDTGAGNYSNLQATISKFKQLGPSVYLQELDVASNKVNSLPQPWTDALAAQQKTDYYNIVKSALAGGANLINVWGVRDNNDAGWLPDRNPLLWDVNYHKKPAYYGVQKALFYAAKQ